VSKEWLDHLSKKDVETAQGNIKKLVKFFMSKKINERDAMIACYIFINIMNVEFESISDRYNNMAAELERLRSEQVKK
jgi:hypothetical protein